MKMNTEPAGRGETLFNIVCNHTMTELVTEMVKLAQCRAANLYASQEERNEWLRIVRSLKRLLVDVEGV